MGVVENMKDVAELIKKLGDIELNRWILNLENEVLDLAREKRRAEEKVEELERTLRFKQDLVFDEPYFWLKGDATPYCPGCWENGHKAVHLVFAFDNNRNARHDCPACKHSYVILSTTWHNVRSNHQRLNT